MRRNRPASITVIGILNCIFGGLGLACGLCAGVQLAAGNQMFSGMGGGAQQQEQEKLQHDMQKAMDEKVPSNKVVSFAGVGIELLTSVLLLVSGIGLLKMQPWGRTLAFLYAFLSIAWKLFTAVYAFVFTIPAVKEFLSGIPRQQGKEGEAQAAFLSIMNIAILASGIIPLVFLIYPIVVLIIMAQPSVKAALLSQPLRPTYEEEDYRDEPEDYRDEPEDR